MKYIKLYEDFVTEKAYQMTGMYGAKGIIGKVLFAFKKQVERIKYEGDVNATLAEINAIWTKWADKDGAKIIEDLVMKQVKNEEAIVYITATLSKAQWEADTVNALNSPGNSQLYIIIARDFVINVGFADDVDGNKFSRKLDGMTNTANNAGKDTVITGTYDSHVGGNNVEIRSSTFLTIDAK